MSQTYRSRPDFILLLIVMALLSIGLLMVFSASPTMAMKIGDPYYYLKRHILALGFGSLALYAGYKIDYDLYKNWALYLVVLAAALLSILFIPGVGMGIGGSTRWIYLGLFSFQPAELAKLALIIFIAKELTSKPLSAAVYPIVTVTLIYAMLILKQPDLGTMIIICAISLSMLYLAGIQTKKIALFLLASIFSFFILSIKSPYRIRRLLAYIDPWNDPQGIGFHIIQSLIAVGSGGIFGLGLGGSKQKFFYLPQNYTDFIFAIFCEEMGLIGALGLLVLFLLFIGRGIRIIRCSPDNFSMMLAGGIVLWLGFQSILNICVVLGIVPTTGIPLPFISYGGTSIVLTLFAVGILLNISQYRITPRIVEGTLP